MTKKTEQPGAEAAASGKGQASNGASSGSNGANGAARKTGAGRAIDRVARSLDVSAESSSARREAGARRYLNYKDPHWVPVGAAFAFFAAVDMLVLFLTPGANRSLASLLPPTLAGLVVLLTLPSLLALFDKQQESIEHQKRQIATLHAMDTAIASERELEAVLDMAARQATMALDGERGGIALLDEACRIEAEAYHNTPDDSRDFMRSVVVSGRGDDFWQVARVPVTSGEGLLGYLAVVKPQPGMPFTAESLGLLRDLAGTVVVAVKNAHALESARHLARVKTMLMADLDAAQIEILERLAQAAEYRDDDTGHHTQRVGRISALLARALGLSEEAVALIRRAAPLHDVGKIGIADAVLLKAGKLTEDEFSRMQAHTRAGAALLAGGRSPLVQTAERIARTHHERWDGSGYPLGLAGEAIPIEGRIVAVADVFDALTHARVYKQAWPVEEAVAEIGRQSGRQFDPRVTQAFLNLPHDSLL